MDVGGASTTGIAVLACADEGVDEIYASAVVEARRRQTLVDVALTATSYVAR